MVGAVSGRIAGQGRSMPEGSQKTAAEISDEFSKNLGLVLAKRCRASIAARGLYGRCTRSRAGSGIPSRSTEIILK
jgi:hypothetical protein